LRIVFRSDIILFTWFVPAQPIFFNASQVSVLTTGMTVSGQMASSLQTILGLMVTTLWGVVEYPDGEAVYFPLRLRIFREALPAVLKSRGTIRAEQCVRLGSSERTAAPGSGLEARLC
jgi:hypothetical protein